jgi:putative transposase
VYPRTEVQLGIVHMVPKQPRICELERTRGGGRGFAKHYRAPTAEAGMAALDSFEGRWNSKYAAIGKLWGRHWAGISPQFAYHRWERSVCHSIRPKGADGVLLPFAAEDHATPDWFVYPFLQAIREAL